MAEIAVVTYFILLCISLLIISLKYKEINASLIGFSLYTISAWTSIYYFNNGVYNYSNIRIEPILYVFICVIITFIPILKYDNVNKKELYGNKRTMKWVYYSIVFFTVISIEPFLENLIHLPTVLSNQNSLASIYDSRASGNNTNNEYLSWIGRKFFWINFLLRDIIPVIFFYYIAKWEKIDKRLLLGLSLSILNPIIHSFALGGRSTIITSVFYIVFVYALFRNFVRIERKRMIDKILIVIGCVIIFAISIITIVRFYSSEHSIDIWTWVSLYTGEGVLNFCSDLWPISKTSNGDNTFLIVRNLLGLTDNVDIESVRETRDILGVRNLVFYTYLGTIYYDFNKIGTFVFVCIFSLLFIHMTKIRNNKVRLGQLVYLSILGKVIMVGVMFYPYTLWNDQLALLFLLIFNYFISLKEKHLI